jgi:DNA-binding response OmpR family regulator
MRALILLVDADRTALRRMEMALSEAGHLVAAVSSFAQAKTLLDAVSPDLLITSVRLGAFNGLHLAVRSRAHHPLVPVILTHPTADAGMDTEARQVGAALIVDPLANPSFLLQVQTAIARHARTQRPIRRWRRKQVEGVLETQFHQAPARICDVSYGGMKVAFPAEQNVPEVFDVQVPGHQVTVKARSIWTVQSAADEVWCGAELVDNEAPSVAGWREFVDET